MYFQYGFPYNEVKVTYFGKSEEVLSSEFHTTAMMSLQSNTYNGTGKMTLTKSYTNILTVNSC